MATKQNPTSNEKTKTLTWFILFVALFIIIWWISGTILWLLWAWLLTIIYCKKKQLIIEKTISPRVLILYLFLSIIFSTLMYFSLIDWVIDSPWIYPGISIFIWEVFFLVSWYFIIYKKPYTLPSKASLFFILTALTISFWYVIFTQYFFSLVYFLGLLIVNSLYLISLRNSNIKLKDIFYWWGSYFSSFLYVYDSVKALKNVSQGSSAFSLLKTVGPILLLFLVLSVIFPLLLSADSVFKKLLQDILENLSLDSWIFLDIGIIIVLSLFVFTFFLFHSFHKRSELFQTRISFPKLDAYYEYIVLWWVICVYSLFVFIQFKYLFFWSHDMFQSLWLTYANYVHEGFYQLIAIAGINFGLLYFFSGLRIEWFSQKTWISKVLFLSLWVLTLCMVYSAYIRIWLYIEAYHLTILRFFVVYIIVALLCFYVLLLCAALIYIRYAFSGFFLCVFLSFIWVSYTNLDARIAQYNIDKAENFEDIDTKYILKNLSRDAIKQKRYIIQSLPEHFGVSSRDELIDGNGYKSPYASLRLSNDSFENDGWNTIYRDTVFLSSIDWYFQKEESIGYYYNYFMNQYISE